MKNNLSLFTKIRRKLAAVLLLASLLTVSLSQNVHAEIFFLTGGIEFNSNFYAAYYPDVRAKYGTNTKKLLNHYLDYGYYEGRIPSAKYLNNMNKLSLAAWVPYQKLANRRSLNGSLAGKDVSLAVVHAWATQFIDAKCPGAWTASRYNRVKYLTEAMRDQLYHVPYTLKSTHHNDPAGVLNSDPTKLGASCAGGDRALGLCLNAMGIPYEHVNENKMKHQWLRVNVDGVFYVCDPYPDTFCFAPEPAPYKHPLIP